MLKQTTPVSQHNDAEQYEHLKSIESVERSVFAGFKHAARNWNLEDLDEEELADLAGLAEEGGGTAMVRHLLQRNFDE